MARFRWFHLWPAALLIAAGCSTTHRSAVTRPAGATPSTSSSTATSASAGTTTPSPATTGAAPTTRPGTSTAGGATIAGPTGGPVPTGFNPVSVTWISLDDGWVLGAAPCAHAPCTSLLRTLDGGATWRAVPAPPTALSASGTSGASGVTELRFADAADGWIFGPDLWATHNGGVTWQSVTALGGAVKSLEAADGDAYAEVAAGSGTRLFVSSTARDDWRPLGSQALDGATLLTLHGTAGYAFAASGAVVAFSASGLQTRSAPCVGMGTAPVALSAGAGAMVAALCVGNPAAGSSTKTVTVSADGGSSWTLAGTTPLGGQPAGLAQASSGTYVVAAVSGASDLYRSADGGHDWSTAYSIGGGPSLSDLGFTATTRGTVVLGATGIPLGKGLSSHLLVTTNGGAHWATLLG